MPLYNVLKVVQVTCSKAQKTKKQSACPSHLYEKKKAFPTKMVDETWPPRFSIRYVSLRRVIII